MYLEGGPSEDAQMSKENHDHDDHPNEGEESIIRRLLQYELDLEILQKWKEVQVIREELERGQMIKALLEKLLVNEYVYGGIDQGPQHTINRASSVGPLEHRRSESALPIVRRVAAQQAYSSFRRMNAPTNQWSHQRTQHHHEPQCQYDVRGDGKIVRMVCPKCGAQLFRSMLGFLNHCRIHCRLVFSSHDERLARCGVVVVDPGEVPLDYFQKHPSLLKLEMDLATIRADVTGPILLPDDEVSIVSGSSNKEETEDEVNITTTSNSVPSRFYVKKSIIVGNAARTINEEDWKKDPLMKQFTSAATGSSSTTNTETRIPSHKWRLFVRNLKNHTSTPNSPNNDLGTFIKGIRFYLHPSYKPNHIVELVGPGPFELERPCWGEFPVRMEIHFWDHYNLPIEIVHHIRVSTVTTARWSTVTEVQHDLNLDKRTDFSTLSSATSTSTVVLPPPPSSDTSLNVSEEDVLTLCIVDFPLGGKRGKRAISAKYKPAVSTLEDFLRLDLAEQKRLEQVRARALCNHLLNTFPSFSWSTEDIVKWCRDKEYTPPSVATLVAAFEESCHESVERLKYCRFCGLAHLPQEKFEILQKNCSLRPRKIHVSSKTPGHVLFKRYPPSTLLPPSHESFKRLKQEHFGPTYVATSSDPSSSSFIDSFTSTEKGGGGTLLSDEVLLECWVDDTIRELQLVNAPPPAQPHSHGPSFPTHLMAKALKSFINRLVKHSIEEIPIGKEHSDERPIHLTPLHVYRTVCSRTDYDFLSNAYMLGGTDPTKTSNSDNISDTQPSN